jgi:hypothetical protein
MDDRERFQLLVGPRRSLRCRVGARFSCRARPGDDPADVVSSISPKGLIKEDAARFIGEDTTAIEHLIRTRKLAYVQHGSQQGRVIPVESLRQLLRKFRQDALANDDRDGRK